MRSAVKTSMRACAFGDLHGPENTQVLEAFRKEMNECSLLMLAGDITRKNDIDSFGLALQNIKSMTEARMIAVFGNEEYEGSHQEYRSRYDVHFLEEEELEFEVDGMRIRVVGSTGVLDRPTWWQRNNMPGVWQVYRQRVTRISELLERKDSEVLILLTHYPPTYATLEGERPSAWPEMGSKSLEGVLMQTLPDLALHAHAHKGRSAASLSTKQKKLDELERGRREVKVLNVSLPARGKPTFIEISKGEDGAKVTDLL